jgi:hypothetical protein
VDFEAPLASLFEKIAEWILVGSLVEQFTDGKDRRGIKRVPPSDGLDEENAESTLDRVVDCPVDG